MLYVWYDTVQVMAVDSEHQKNTQHDYWRTRSTLRALARNNHVQSKFTTGDRCTLKEVTEANGKSVRDELLKFHKKYYRPDMMSVAVISSHSLDVLERSVTSLFGSIPRADSAVIAKAEAIPEPVLTADYTDVFHSRYLMSKVDTEGLGVAGPEIKLLHEIIDRQDAVPHHPRSFINAIPLQEVRSLNISFAMPPVGSSYTKQVHHFFGHLIGHEGPGSLLSYLKSQSLANSLSAGLSHDGDDLGMMSVTMDLTPEGEANIDEVVCDTSCVIISCHRLRWCSVTSPCYPRHPTACRRTCMMMQPVRMSWGSYTNLSYRSMIWCVSWLKPLMSIHCHMC